MTNPRRPTPALPRLPLRPVVLLAVIAGALALPPSTASAGTWIGDTTSGWAHIGGGVGVRDEPGELGGRAMLGAGFYTIGFYAGGELDATFTKQLPISLAGIGMFGVHIPTPVVHPMFGLRFGGGFASDGKALGPTAIGGAQIGFIVRQFDGQYGFRLMLDVDAVALRTKENGLLGQTTDYRVYPQAMVTGAFVW